MNCESVYPGSTLEGLQVGEYFVNQPTVVTLEAREP